jgi:hypothetical protein
MFAPAYPVRVDGALDRQLSRWLWLVKWFLAMGVLRWTWRVQYYSYGALGTDHYPPFSLHDDPAYPARLQVEYPQQLSRGLVLVKWWLLAIPHYLVVGLFVGGTIAVWHGGGLVGVLVLIAAVAVAVTGTYPEP